MKKTFKKAKSVSVFLGADTEPELNKGGEKLTDSDDSLREKSPSVCDCLSSIFV